MSQDYSALHALAFMYLTMSHQGDGEITEDELLQVRRFVNKYSYESATLRQQGLVAIDDNVTQTLHDVNMWYDRALNEGNEGVFRQFSVLVGQAPKLFFDKEYLYRIYGELEAIAAADGEITDGERALLDKTAEVWELGDIEEGKKLYEQKYAPTDGSVIAWPYGEYDPLHADIFMFNAISVIGDGVLTEEEGAVVRLRITSWGTRGVPDEYIDEAFNLAGIWFNDVLNSEGTDEAIRTFHAIGVVVAEINNYNPNVLHLKMQLFRDCCAADGEIAGLEKELLDDLADSWKLDKDWTKRLPRYKAFSDYEEKDIEGVYEFFEPLKNYFRLCFGIGAYSFAHEGNSMFLKDNNSYMFLGHPEADDANELPQEKELMLILDDKASDPEYVNEVYGDVHRTWVQNCMRGNIMTDAQGEALDFNEPHFMTSVDNLLAGINIATTSPGKPSDNSLVTIVYKLLVECAEHNKGAEEGLYENVIAKLEMIKEKWGVTEEVVFSGVVEDPEFDEDDYYDGEDEDEEDDEEDGEEESIYAYDCDCGFTSKIKGKLLQEYIDEELTYDCDGCDEEIDPEIGWYPISLDEYIAD